MTPTLRASLAILVLAAIPSCIVTDSAPPDDCTGPSVIGSADLYLPLGATAAPSATGEVCLLDDGKPEVARLTWLVETVPVDSVINTADLDLTNPSMPTFVPDVLGVYVLSVTASDSKGTASNADYIVVTVGSSTEPPIADCGENVTAEVNERVDLNGSGSEDPEDSPLTYEWSMSSWPECSRLSATSVYNGTTVSPSVVPDCEGVFVVGLVVSDGYNWSNPDFCNITVKADNALPVADAGEGNDNLSPCTDMNFELNGYGSYDLEGAPLTYLWSIVSAPLGSTANFAEGQEVLPNPDFRRDMPGTYTFELRVHDGVNASPPDVVSFTFTDANSNSPPVANAGANQTVNVTARCTTASYVFTCGDCEPTEVMLDGTATDDPVDGDELNFWWSESTGEISIVSPSSPETRVLIPGYPSTYGVALRKTWTVGMGASDCADTDTDTVLINYTCTGAL